MGVCLDGCACVVVCVSVSHAFVCMCVSKLMWRVCMCMSMLMYVCVCAALHLISLCVRCDQVRPVCLLPSWSNAVELLWTFRASRICSVQWAQSVQLSFMRSQHDRNGNVMHVWLNYHCPPKVWGFTGADTWLFWIYKWHVTMVTHFYLVLSFLMAVCVVSLCVFTLVKRWMMFPFAQS